MNHKKNYVKPQKKSVETQNFLGVVRSNNKIFCVQGVQSATLASMLMSVCRWVLLWGMGVGCPPLAGAFIHSLPAQGIDFLTTDQHGEKRLVGVGKILKFLP